MSKLHAAALADTCAIAGVAALIWPSGDPKVATPVQTVEQYVIAPPRRVPPLTGCFRPIVLKNSFLDDAAEDPSLIGPSPFPAHGRVPAIQELMTKSRYGTRRGTLDLSLLVAQHSR
jgi:hypothetical protein